MKKISISSVVLILYAIVVLINELIGNPYGLIVGWAGLVVGILLILEAILRK